MVPPDVRVTLVVLNVTGRPAATERGGLVSVTVPVNPFRLVILTVALPVLP